MATAGTATRRMGRLAVYACAALVTAAQAFAQTLPAGIRAQDASRPIQGDLRAALTAARAWVNEDAADTARGAADALRAAADRLRAADLLLSAGAPDLERTLRERGAPASIFDRQARMAATFRQAFDKFYGLVDPIFRVETPLDRTARRAALQALVEYLQSQIDPPLRTPLAETAYRTLDLAQRTPQFGAVVVPAYAKADVPAAPADVASTPDAEFSAPIVNTARDLGQDPIAIFEFVRNTIAIDFYAGAMKSAAQTLLDKSANDVDQASLLIALLRASGTPARYVRGVIALPGEQAARWIGVSTPGRAAQMLTRAGIPFRSIEQGGAIAAFEIEHTWVEAYVPYTNYRGVALESSGRAWIPLDPSLTSTTVTAGIDPASLGLTAASLVDAYLAGPQTLSPAEYDTKKFKDALAQLFPDKTFEQAITRHTIQAISSGLLPNTLPYRTVSVNEETAVLPDALRHHVRFIAQADGGAAFDVTLPASALVGRRVTLSYVPATVEDQIAADAYLGIDNTPAYLLRLRPVLKVGGEVRGAGELAVQMGALHEFAIEIQSPARTIRVTNQMIAGGFYAVAFAARELTVDAQSERAPQDTEKAAADLLYQMAATYQQRWNGAEDQIADLVGVTVARPMLSEVIVGSIYNRTVAFGQPQAIDWRGVFVDADLRIAEPVAIGASDAPARDFMRLSGLAGSMLEGEVLDTTLQVDSVSAARLIQRARAAGVPVDRIDQSNVDAALPLLDTAEEVKADIRDAVRRGSEVLVPRHDVTENIWTGIGYIVLDPDSGAAGYFISGSLAGGSTTEDPETWVQQQFVAELGHPYQDAPDTEPSAVFSIRKVVVSDKQEATAGHATARPLAVWVRDGEGRPVQGALVTFTVLAGGGDFAGNPSITVMSDYLGIARATPALGKHTEDVPFYVKKTGDTFATRVGQNIISAKAAGAGGDVPLDEPFQLFGYPGAPSRITKILGDGNQAIAATAGGTLLARLEDEFGNAISNVDLRFRTGVARPASGGGTLPADARNLVVYPQTPPCPTPNPILGDCNGAAESIVTSTVFGAAVETILGDTAATIFPVSVAAPANAVPSQQFELRSAGARTFGTGNYVSPELTISRLEYINDKGQLLDAAKVGTTFADSLGVVVRLIEDNYILEKVSDSCAQPSDPPCYRIRSRETVRVRPADFHLSGPPILFADTKPDAVSAPKQTESADVAFTPTLGGGTTSPVTPTLGGRYASTLTVGVEPAVNRVKVDATAHVWVPYLDLRNGTATPTIADLKPGQKVGSFDTAVSPPKPIASGSPIDFWYDVFGVRARMKKDSTILIGPSGGATKDFKLEYSIEPPQYNASQADVDLFEVQPGASDAPIGLIVGDHKSGDGAATIFQGTPFDPSKAYHAQLVLNRGDASRISSDPRNLDAYFAAPFGSDFRARDNTFEQAGRPKQIDLARELRDERARLVSVLQRGVDAAAASCPLPQPISSLGILAIEQGSGACFWKDGFDTDPVSACGAFHTTVSDHDYEVFIPPTLSSAQTTCVIEAMTDVAETEDQLGDVTFFPLPKQELENALLNIDLPAGIGSDQFGDLGLGRQTLLLSKILLEGEYVGGVPGLNDPAAVLSLDAIREKLRTHPTIPGEATGIPRLEGYEQAVLQSYAFYKSRAHLRMTGPGLDSKSYLYELALKEMRGAAKAAIRAALGRLVADVEGNKLLFISRQQYRSGGCVTGATDPSHPPPLAELYAKTCDTFEEHVASTAIKSFRQGLGIFTEDQVRQIYDFYRVKAEVPCAAPGCQTQPVDEAQANAFVAAAVSFIDQVTAATYDVWAATKDLDSPDRVIKRGTNVATAMLKANDAKSSVTLTLEDRIVNENGALFRNIPLRLFSSTASDINHVVPNIKSHSETIVDVERDASGNPIKDEGGKVQPIFKTTFPTADTNQLKIALDPGNTIRECNKADNYSGFFAYPLNPSDPAVPNFGELPPPVPLPTPPPECAENPLPQLKVTKLVNGQPHIEVARFTKLAVSHRLQNTGLVPLTGIVVTDQLTQKSYGPFALAPGGWWTFEDTYDATASNTGLVGPSQAIAFAAGGGIATAWDSVGIDVVTPSCSALMAPLDPDPNPLVKNDDGSPARPGSEVMQGGALFRYYRAIDRFGNPVKGANVMVSVNGITFVASTNDEGELVHNSSSEDDDPRGLRIEADAIGGPGFYRANFVSVNGGSVCSPVFWVKVKRREFSRTWTAGSKIEVEGTVGAGLEGKAGAGVSIGLDDRAQDTRKKLSLTRSVDGEIGVQIGVAAGVEATTPLGEAGLGAEAKASAGVTFMASDTHEFQYPPNSNQLAPVQAAAFGGLMFATIAGGGPSNPFLTKLLDALVSQAIDFSQYRTTDSAAVGVTVNGSISGEAGVDVLPIGGFTESGVDYGVGAQASLSGAATAVVGVDHKRLDHELVPNFTLSAQVDLSGAIGVGSVSDQNKKNVIQLKTALRRGLKGTLSGKWKAKLTLDQDHGYTPTKLTIAYTTVKGFGFKWEGGAWVVINDSNPDKNTVTYTITDPAAIQEALDKLASLAKLAAVGSIAPAPPIGAVVLGPALLVGEMVSLFDLLDHSDAGYDHQTETGDGVKFPIKIKLADGAEIKLAAALSFDRAIGFSAEKGVVKKGVSFPLERYKRDQYVPGLPSVVSDLEELFTIAADGVGGLVGGIVDVVTKPIVTGLNSIRSRATAQLDFDGASLAAPQISLSSFKYAPVLGPVAAGAVRPGDVSGPADVPHFGIGGFHHFTPEGQTLTAPATLTIFYDQSEVASIDEQSLAIYTWNAGAQEWDYVGGTVDPTANTVTTTVNRLGIYTAAPAMPGRTFTFTAQSSADHDPEHPQTTVTYTSGTIRMNNGLVVPDGTAFTVEPLWPQASEKIPFGVVTSADEDPVTPGVQVTSHNGVIAFTAKYPGNFGYVRVRAFSTRGTAFSNQIIPY